MNHYDDLQRFKEKTRTQGLKFKDLSSETTVGEKGDWTILNQLMPVTEEPTLAMGGTASSPLPQLVSADTFSSVESQPVQITPPPSTVAPFVAVPESVAVSAPPVPVAPVAVETVVQERVTPPESVHQAVVSQLTPASVPAPAIRPRPAIAPATEGFAHLFATKTAAPEPVAEGKDQPLKSLLERIAACR